MSATPEALAAVRAAKCRFQWGPWCLEGFLAKQGVPARHFFHALRFEQRRGSK